MVTTMNSNNSEPSFLAYIRQLDEITQPHELSPYLKAVSWAQKQGVTTTQQTHKLNSIEALSEDMLSEKCVIKLADGWSAKALMIVDPEPNNRFFDHVTLRSYGLKKLKEKLTQLYNSTLKGVNQQWVVESRESGAFPSTVSPVSYSFYVFNGVVGFISQTDYNFATQRACFFDGAFSPLAFGRDVSLNSRNLAQGNHLIPQQGARYLKIAQELSLKTKTPFVTVQLFATANGPVFAGFDFSPRLLSKDAIKLSSDFVAQLDDKLSGAQTRLGNSSLSLVEGQTVDSAVRFSALLSAVNDSNLVSVEEIPTWKYQRLATVAEKGEARGAWRLSDKYKQLEESASNRLASLVNERMSSAWDEIKKLNMGS